LIARSECCCECHPFKHAQTWPPTSIFLVQCRDLVNLLSKDLSHNNIDVTISHEVFANNSVCPQITSRSINAKIWVNYVCE